MHIQNVVTLEKYLNLFLKNSCLKLINFEAFFDRKVPKISVFNRECLENDDFWKWKNHENQKWVKLKNPVFKAFRKICSRTL